MTVYVFSHLIFAITGTSYIVICRVLFSGENLEETVHREVAEEVGIEVSSVRYVASQHWPFPGSLMAGCFATAEKQKVRGVFFMH